MRLFRIIFFLLLYNNQQLEVKYFLTVGYIIFNMVEEIKTRLREEIRRSGLTTVELARRVGVTPEMITQYCTTKKLPRLDTFAKLCQELDVSADYILGLPE